jgi:coenzyme F420-reducing hydrogenase alpha subunit
MASRIIKTDVLARVEGEGALRLVIRDGEVRQAQLKIFEPPRFFESFLRGRAFGEAPDITARICGICPVAYQMSSVHAMESALGVKVDGAIRDLRRLLYCGEWIESNTLHVYMLHAPDFLGYDGGVEMARDHPEVVRRGLQLKKTGNELMAVIGGREVHPVNVKVGGFYKLPRRRDLDVMAEKMKRARDAALETVRWVAGFEYPDLERDYEFVALRNGDDYPMNEGRIVSSKGIDIAAADFLDHFEEEHVRHSNALQARIKTRGRYAVGPMARYNLNADVLSLLARDAAREAGLGDVCSNPFQSIIVRAVEVLYACDEAIRIIEGYDDSGPPAVPLEPRAGVGHGCTEAPRGMLYHRYAIDDDGLILDARIVPPTSQNQASMEEDLTAFAAGWLDLQDEDLRWRCEQTIRNYDPCISCATHFLRLDVDRRAEG